MPPCSRYSFSYQFNAADLAASCRCRISASSRDTTAANSRTARSSASGSPDRHATTVFPIASAHVLSITAVTPPPRAPPAPPRTAQPPTTPHRSARRERPRSPAEAPSQAPPAAPRTWPPPPQQPAPNGDRRAHRIPRETGRRRAHHASTPENASSPPTDPSTGYANDQPHVEQSTRTRRVNLVPPRTKTDESENSLECFTAQLIHATARRAGGLPPPAGPAPRGRGRARGRVQGLAHVPAGMTAH